MTLDAHELVFQQFHQDLLYAESARSALDEQLRRELEGSEFLSENAYEFGQLMCEFLDVLHLHLRVQYHPQLRALWDGEGEQGQADPGAERRLELRIHAAAQVAAGLTSLLKYVYGSNAKSNPWGIVAQIDRLCRGLFPEARAIIRPGWEYNYTFFPLSLQLDWIVSLVTFSDRMLARGLRNALEDEHYFFSLTYSPTAVDNVLNMAIWAHEIGHAVDNMLADRPAGSAEEDDQSRLAGLSYSSRHFNDFEITPEELKAFLAGGTGEGADGEPIDQADTEQIMRAIQSWKQEFFADLFSVRLFGPAALFAFTRFVKPLSTGFDVSSGLTHPPLALRLTAMLRVYERWNGEAAWVQELPPHVREAYRGEISYLQELAQAGPSASSRPPSPQEQILGHLVDEHQLIDRLADLVDGVVGQNPDCYLSPQDMAAMPAAVRDLENSLPPDFPHSLPSSQNVGANPRGCPPGQAHPQVPSGEGARGQAQGTHGQPQGLPLPQDIEKKKEAKVLGLTINAGWLTWLSKVYQHRHGEAGVNQGELQDRWLRELDNINLLLLKSIENAEARRWFADRRRFSRRQDERERSDTVELPAAAMAGGGALAGDEISARIYAEGPAEGSLEVRPLLDSESQVGTCSLDVRLGNEFIITKLPVLTRLDPTEMGEGAGAQQFQSKLHLPLGKPFVLHPGQFVLGSTLEYLALPEDVMGLLMGRSSWKRLGLVLASPTKIVPGFKGCVTLELTNLGNAPLLLYPCARIGQVVFVSMQVASSR
jgi:dCTP deaminase